MKRKIYCLVFINLDFLFFSNSILTFDLTTRSWTSNVDVVANLPAAVQLSAGARTFKIVDPETQEDIIVLVGGIVNWALTNQARFSIKK